MRTAIFLVLVVMIVCIRMSRADEIRLVCSPIYTQPVTWDCHEENRYCAIFNGTMTCEWSQTYSVQARSVTNLVSNF